jgi:hypothetical protein
LIAFREVPGFAGRRTRTKTSGSHFKYYYIFPEEKYMKRSGTAIKTNRRKTYGAGLKAK